MERRTFLKSSSFISLPLMIGGMKVAAVGKQSLFNTLDEDNDNVLVLIQLNGGNDGLNTIIPLDHYDLLANVRSNVLIPEDEILKIENTVGLHPSMTGLKNIYDNAQMGIIRDVGYPNQNRSHFRSSDIWTSGSPADETWTTGWLGRKFEVEAPDYPVDYPNETFPDPFALSIGSNVSETCQGTVTNFSLALSDPTSISVLNTGADSELPDTPYGRELAYLRTTIEQANAYGEVISGAAEKGENISANYPDEKLAQQLKAIALLISGGLKTKVYIANLGGFDTHANQVETGDPTVGNHATLMTRISEAVSAFQEDLRLIGLEERVLTMTFSEFGRRIRSNDSNGTDHGTAAPMMLFGSCVNPGILGGTSALPDQPSQSDGVPMQFDFRNVYGSVLKDWLGIEEEEVKNLLYPDFTALPIIRNCKTTTATDDLAELVSIETSAYPNPFDGWTRIKFNSPGGQVRISIYDSLGHEIHVLTNQDFRKGVHEITYDAHGVSSGNYFYHIITKAGVITKSIVKV